MRFVKARDISGKTILINAEMITEVIPRTTNPEVLDIFFNTSDEENQAQNSIMGSINSFLDGVNVTGVIEEV